MFVSLLMPFITFGAIGYLFGGFTGLVIGLVITGILYAWFNWINPDYS